VLKVDKHRGARAQLAKLTPPEGPSATGRHGAALAALTKGAAGDGKTCCALSARRQGDSDGVG